MTQIGRRKLETRGQRFARLHLENWRNFQRPNGTNGEIRRYGQPVANCDRFPKTPRPRFLPYAFTEHGALMAANVLNSSQAVEMSVHVIRAFVQMRRMLAAHKELTRQLSELESKIGKHDEQIQVIIDASDNSWRHRCGKKVGSDFS